jgi:succinate-semialdehyde dehydrogenase / glutarate-semialdehyde dehydrogenase
MCSPATPISRNNSNKIDAGMVYVNLLGAHGAELPFGGVKRSGSGRELGRYGAHEFVTRS